MLIPEAWDGNEGMSQEKKDFYEYHANLMEPWDVLLPSRSPMEKL